MKCALRWIAIFAVLLLTGCSSTGFDAENYLNPPRPAGILADIQDVLEQYAGTDFTLKYPRSGQYRSAIILEDLDSDGQDEALAFYRPATESGGTHFVIMDTIDNHWKVICEITGPGVDVERVVLTHFDSSNQRSLLIGWNMYSRDKIGTIYSYANNTLTTSITEFSYTEMVVNDFDGDGSNELFSVLLNTTDLTAVAKLMERDISTGYMQTTSEVQLDGNISSYAQVQSGQVTSGGMNGVVIDSYKNSTTLQTEIVYWNSTLKKLQIVGELFVHDVLAPKDLLLRNSTICCMDLDADGVIEIPTLQYCVNLEPITGENGMDSENDAPSFEPVRQEEYYVIWTQLQSYYQAQNVDCSVHMNGYYFLLNPDTSDTWMRKFYFKRSEDGLILTFYQSESDESVLTLQTYTEAAWALKMKNTEYTELLRSNGKVYVYLADSNQVTQRDLDYISTHFYFK